MALTRAYFPVVGLALGCLGLIAWAAGRKERDTRDFFLGGRNAPAVVGTLSFVAAEISALICSVRRWSAAVTHEKCLRFHARPDMMPLEAGRMFFSKGFMMATLQVKGMDDDLYEALKGRAKRDNRSITQEVVTMIRESLARSPVTPGRATRDLLALAGSWEDARPPEDIARSIRGSRRSRRRSKVNGHVFT
jgi:plasmid stability protein